MRERVGRVAWRVAPEWMGDRAHRHRLTLIADDVEARDYLARHGDTVQAGPFSGMRYPPPRVALVAKLRGEYERPIQSWIADGLAHKRFIDVGAADGYYAVGFARAGVTVDAFELSKTARAECAELAGINETEVTLHGAVSGPALRALEPGNAFVLCDIEGAEAELFDDAATIAALRHATVVVELHEHVVPGITETITSRFADTHTFEVRHTDHEQASYELRGEETPWARFVPRS